MLNYMDAQLRRLLLTPPKTFWTAILLVFVLFLFILSIITYSAKDRISAGSEKYVIELATSLSNSLDERIAISIATLRTLSMNYVDSGLNTSRAALASLKVRAQTLNFRQIFFISRSGFGISLDAVLYDFSENKKIMSALKGKDIFLECQCSDHTMPTNHLAIVTPIYKNNEVIGLIMAYLDDNWAHGILSQDVLDGRIIFTLLDRSGYMLLKSMHFVEMGGIYRQATHIQEIFRTMRQERIVEQVDEQLSHNKETPLSLSYSYNESHRDAVMLHLQHYPLYLYFSCIEGTQISEFSTLNKLLLFSAVCVVLLLLTMCIVFAWFYQSCRALAFNDPVTGGMTNIRFELEMREDLRTAQPGEYFFYSININKFKIFNEFFGRSEGDLVLKVFYSNLREILPSNAILCRVSPDEFDILCNKFSTDFILRCIAKAASDTIRALSSLHNDETNYRFTVRVGIRSIVSPTEDYVIIKDHAGIARDRAQKSFSEYVTYDIYNEEDLTRARREKSMENFMQHSLLKGDFYVVLQPKVMLKDNSIYGAEALVRWKHPELGFIAPDEFISLFERNGFVRTLDVWVFKTICKIMHSWKEKGYPLLTISVNLSRVDIDDENAILKEYARIADLYEIPRHYLELELTETAFCKEPKFIQNAINEIRTAGFQCSIDDFGTGYSSLNLLQELNVDTLKIDRSFFSSLSLKERDKIIIHMIITLAHKLGIHVIAEGVETTNHKDFLYSCGCLRGQGYLFSKPLLPEDFEKFAFAPNKDKSE